MLYCGQSQLSNERQCDMPVIRSQAKQRQGTARYDTRAEEKLQTKNERAERAHTHILSYTSIFMDDKFVC